MEKNHILRFEVTIDYFCLYMYFCRVFLKLTLAKLKFFHISLSTDNLMKVKLLQKR